MPPNRYTDRSAIPARAAIQRDCRSRSSANPAGVPRAAAVAIEAMKETSAAFAFVE
jgi:hypothetical protein